MGNGESSQFEASGDLKDDTDIGIYCCTEALKPHG
jgi:hypothetical protein